MEGLKPSDIKSGPWQGTTEGSYLHAAPVMLVKTDAHGHRFHEKRTSNNVFRAYDVPENGPFAAEIGEGVSRGGYHFSPIGSWKDAIKSPAKTEYVASPPFIGAYESFHESRASNFHPKDTPVLKYTHDFVYDGPMNFVGNATGHIQASRQNLANFETTIERENLASVLKSKGHGIKEFEYVGVAPSGRAIYSIRRVNGKIALVASRYAYDMIVEEARHYNIPPQDLLRLVIAEEITHRATDDAEALEGGADYTGLEIGAKTRVFNSQKKAAEGAKGDPKKGKEQRRLDKMADVMEADIKAVPENYGHLAYQRSNGRNTPTRRQGLEKLVERLSDEADALGVDRTEYISAQLAKNSIKYAERRNDAEAEKPEAPQEDPKEATTADASD